MRQPRHSQLTGLAAHPKGVRLVVSTKRAVGAHPVQPIVDRTRRVAHRPGGNEQRIVSGRHPAGEAQRLSFRSVSHACHIVAETRGESLGQQDDVDRRGQRSQLLFHHAEIGSRVFPADGLLEEGEGHGSM